MFVQSAKLPQLMQSISRFENCVQTLSQTVASYDAKITFFEQIVSSLAARVTALETNATSVVPARQDLGTNLDMVTAPQPLGPSGPMAQGHLMTIEVRGVGLILSQALKMNMHGVPSYYDSHVSNTTLGPYNKPVRIQCKAGSLSARVRIRNKSQVSGL